MYKMTVTQKLQLASTDFLGKATMLAMLFRHSWQDNVDNVILPHDYFKNCYIKELITFDYNAECCHHSTLFKTKT